MSESKEHFTWRVHVTRGHWWRWTTHVDRIQGWWWMKLILVRDCCVRQRHPFI